MSIVQLTAVIVTDPADTTASEAGVDPFTVGFCEGAVGGVLQAMLDSMVAAAITIHPKRVIVMPPTVGLLLNFVGERLLADTKAGTLISHEFTRHPSYTPAKVRKRQFLERIEGEIAILDLALKLSVEELDTAIDQLGHIQISQETQSVNKGTTFGQMLLSFGSPFIITCLIVFGWNCYL